MNEGHKFDTDKTRFDLLDWQFVKGIAEVLTYGAAMHGDNNWRQVKIERYQAALQRHYNYWIEGEALDEESGLHHLLHLACNAMFLWFLSGRVMGKRKDPKCHD